MTNVVSAISDKFTKPLVFGTFLPVVLWSIAGSLTGGLVCPTFRLWSLNALSRSPEWTVAAALGAAVTLSGFLHMLNSVIVRFLEGYPWEKTWLGRRRRKRHLERRRELDLQLHLALSEPKTTDIDIDAVALRLSNDFPESHLVLPTRLGNVIRSFEDYARSEYGIDTVAVWPRLVGVLDKGYAETVDEAKTGFSFFVNLMVLGGLSVLLFGSALIDVVLQSRPWLDAGLCFLFVLAWALIVWACHRGALVQAMLWGDQVKGAFDLYRERLLAKIGYVLPVGDRVAERRLWRDISHRFVFGDNPTRPWRPYMSSWPVACALPPGVELEVARGLRSRRRDDRTVVLQVRNVDPLKQDARDIELSDRIPAGWCYVWGSARASKGSVRMRGADPISLLLSQLAWSEEITVSYEVMRVARDADGIVGKIG